MEWLLVRACLVHEYSEIRDLVSCPLLWTRFDYLKELPGISLWVCCFEFHAHAFQLLLFIHSELPLYLSLKFLISVFIFAFCFPVFPGCCKSLIRYLFLGRLPKFGSRPNNMSVKSPSIRPSVRPSVRPSTKSFFDFDEIWYTGSTRWEMKTVMTMPGSKVKVKVRSPWKSEIRPFWTIFKLYLLPHL